MLCKSKNVKKLYFTAGFLPFLFINMTVVICAPTARAQDPSAEQTDGIISGTVLLTTGNRPASQVAGRLKSSSVGVFCSVLTVFEWHFEARSFTSSPCDCVGYG